VSKGFVLGLATGFGLGRSPVAPGTVGCLLGLPLVYLSRLWGGWGVECVVVVALCLIAIPICTQGERHFAAKDDRRIVADEYLTFPLCMLGLPLTPSWFVICFVTNRICDTIKPPPARQLQAVRGGWGVVVDDVVASLYSLAINHLLYRLLGAGLGVH